MLIVGGILAIAAVLYYLNPTAGIVFGAVALGVVAFIGPRIVRRTKAAIVLRDEFGFVLPDRLQGHLNDTEAALRNLQANEYEIAASFMAAVLKDPERVGLTKNLELEKRYFSSSTGMVLAGKIRPVIANRLTELVEQSAG